MLSMAPEKQHPEGWLAPGQDKGRMKMPLTTNSPWALFTTAKARTNLAQTGAHHGHHALPTELGAHTAVGTNTSKEKTLTPHHTAYPQPSTLAPKKTGYTPAWHYHQHTLQA